MNALGEGLGKAVSEGLEQDRVVVVVVGRVSKEQAADYAKRKGVDLAQAERWLASNLDYDPE